EAALRRHHGTDLAGRKVLLIGGTGTVGRIAAVLCARLGATAVLSSHKGAAAAQAAADQTGQRFGVTLHGVSGHGSEALREALADADVVMGVAAAGVQVMSEADRAHATRMLVAADVNAVPPEGLAGVGVMDDAKPLAGTSAVGIGALAIGNVKYQVQHRLLMRMRHAEKPVTLSFSDAFEVAREVLAEPAR
ncbi:MAG: methylenetetrahydromethanopterin dehydrogenase, partial [Ideonella sp.]|nr:methylenetetrahydromethanopterin dehydrogenase [Ideonella sp.]